MLLFLREAYQARPHTDAIAAMLDADAKVPATVILEHLRRDGYAGGITIVKDHVARIRPAFLAVRSFQRTTYLPGELAHGDWWEPGSMIPIGNGARREAYGWVTTLPHSAAHAMVFSLSKTMADLLHGVLGCFSRLGGMPKAMVVVDNDSSIVADGVGRNAALHPEVAALCGYLRMKLTSASIATASCCMPPPPPVWTDTDGVPGGLGQEPKF